MLSADRVPFRVVLAELLKELGVGANNEATRVVGAATICEWFVGADGAQTVLNHGRGVVAPRDAVGAAHAAARRLAQEQQAPLGGVARL